MAKATTRTHFHSSRLIRVLADLALLETAAPGAAFAERLGHWVAFTDAITLCAVQNAATPASAVTAATAPTGANVAQAFAQLRSELEASIARAGAALAPPSDYEPYRRHYVAQQRDMEARLGPLRVRLREALDRAAPALRQLAALDAAFEGILAEREARLLCTLPLLLNKRFAQLRQAHAPDPAQPEAAPPPAPPPPGKPGAAAAPRLPASAWQLRFGQELQTVLLAELDLRLQPALGLLEAFENEKTQDL